MNFNDRIKWRDLKLENLPQPLPVDPEQRLVRVFVEGYEDVAFWRGIFDHFTHPKLRFEISVPTREDLPKGKKVVMSMIPDSCDELILCVDSDFDYLFDDLTPQSRDVNHSKYLFHTYAYATESYLCYAPSLHNVCVKATKNDSRIFDFERFLEEYSQIIFPIFLWYCYSAQMGAQHMLTLVEFKQCVSIRFLDSVETNGAETLKWLRGNVDRKLAMLRNAHPDMDGKLATFEQKLRQRGLTERNTYLYMQGHTLLDNVVMVLLNCVCDKLRQISIARIIASVKKGTALKNEMSNYINSLHAIRDVLLDNEGYRNCPQYLLLRADIQRYLERL